MKLKDAYNEVFGGEDVKIRYKMIMFHFHLMCSLRGYKPPFFEQHEDIDSLAHWIEQGVAAVLVYKTFFTYRAVTLSRAPIAQFCAWQIKRVDVDAAIEFIEQKKGFVNPALKPMLEAQRGPYVCEIFIKDVNWHSNSSWSPSRSQNPKDSGNWYEQSSTGYRFYKKGREFTLFRARYVDASYTRGKPLYVKADSSTLREFIDEYFKSVPESEKEIHKKNQVVGKRNSFSTRSGDLPEDVTSYLKRKGLLFSV